MSNRFPLTAPLMEFSEQLQLSGIPSEVWWAPREVNLEAQQVADPSIATSAALVHSRHWRWARRLDARRRNNSMYGSPLRGRVDWWRVSGDVEYAAARRVPSRVVRRDRNHR